MSINSLLNNTQSLVQNNSTITSLSQSSKLSDNLRAVSINDEIKKFSTTFSFGSFNYESDSDLYLIYKNSMIDVSTASDIDHNNNYYFTVELVDYENCKIYHQTQDTNYYWVASYQDSKIYLSTDINTATTFKYVLDNSGGISLAILVGGVAHYISLDRNNAFGFYPYKNIETSNSIRIRPLYASSLSLQHSWVRYNTLHDNQSLILNSSRSKSDVDSNIISKIIVDNQTGNTRLEVIPAMTHLSEIQTVSKGSIYGDDSKFRIYTSVYDTGNSTSKSIQDTNLGVVQFTQSYIVYPDSYTKVTVGNLAPFSQLNVNDTRLILEGSIGGDFPLNSDRITYGVPTSSSTLGMHLCTWLSSSKVPGESSVWVDRYYNPKAVSRDFAYSMVNANYMLSLSSSNQYTDFLTANSYISFFDVYDKRSDFCVKEDDSFYYYRVGQKTSNIIRGLYNDNFITSSATIFDEQDIAQQLGVSSYTLSSSYANVYANELLGDEKTGTINLIFDGDIANKPLGTTLWSNFNDVGIEVINQLFFTPLIHAYTRTSGVNTINVINTDLQVIDSFVVPTIPTYIYQERSNDPIVINGQAYSTNGLINKSSIYPTLTASNIGFYNQEHLNALSSTTLRYKTSKTELVDMKFDTSGASATLVKVTTFNPGTIQTTQISASLASGSNVVGFTLLNDDRVSVLYQTTSSTKIATFSTDSSVSSVVDITTPIDGYTPRSIELISDFRDGTVIESYFIVGNKASSHKFWKIGLDGTVLKTLVLSSELLPLATTHYNHQRVRYNNLPKTPLYVRLVTDNYQDGSVTKAEMCMDASTIASGLHMLTLRLNQYQQEIGWYLDDALVDKAIVKFNHTNKLNKSNIFLGTPLMISNTPLQTYTKIPSQGLASGITIHEHSILDTTLDVYDALSIFRSYFRQKPFTFTLPAGQKRYVEAVNAVYSDDSTPITTSHVDINISTHEKLTSKQKQFIIQTANDAALDQLPAVNSVRNINL